MLRPSPSSCAGTSLGMGTVCSCQAMAAVYSLGGKTNMALGHVSTFPPRIFLERTFPKTGWAKDARTQEASSRIRPARG